MDFKALQIAQLIEGEIIGDENREVNGFANIDKAGARHLSFLGNPKYLPQLKESNAGVVIITESFDFEPKEGVTYIKVKEAYESITQLLVFYDAQKPEKQGIEQPSFIADSAKVGENPYIGAFAYIGENVKIGHNVKIYPHTYIGDNSTIGDNTILYSGVKIYSETSIGKECIIHANSVIGGDGFGFKPNEKGELEKVPQIGHVIIEDNVELGSSCTIDRGTMGATIIKSGTKLDNQIQVAHNVEIGCHNAIASQTGIAGSTKIGNHNMIGGQVGIAGHLTMGSQLQIQAQSGINRNIKDGEKLFGTPAMDAMKFRKSYIHFRNLPEIEKRLQEVEKKITKQK